MIALLAYEMRQALRSRWFLAVTGVFAALALGVSYLSFTGAGALGFAGFNRTVAGLLNLVLLFVPLMGLLLGALGLSGEREDGTLGYLLSQPVGRAPVFLAKCAGLWLSLALSIGLGLGAAGLVVGWRAGAGDLGAYGVLALSAVLLGAASVGPGVLLSVACSSRMRALAWALLLWVLFAFLLDAVAVGLVAGGKLGAVGLFHLSLANPIQLAKTITLLALSARLEVLGPAGIHGVKTYGGTGAALLLSGALVAWAALPAAAGLLRFRRMNVT